MRRVFGPADGAGSTIRGAIGAPAMTVPASSRSSLVKTRLRRTALVAYHFPQFGYIFPMNDTEREILATLQDLETKVQGMKTANPKPNLLAAFERLDTLTRELGPKGDPSLLHYLHKKSYEKE